MLADPLSPAVSPLIRSDGRPVEWVVAPGYVPYEEAVAEMEARVARIAAGEAAERVWLLEHPPLYTAGVSAKDDDLIDAGRFPVHRTGRGGQFTYHGPGQRVAYVMLDLNRRGKDVRGFVRGLEQWLIGALDQFGVEADVRDGRVGVWVERKGSGWSREDKIAAIGVKVRKWVSFHGVSLNVEPDLDHFGGIVPCGIAEHGVTSLLDLGVTATMDEADAALKASFLRVFGAAANLAPTK
ncbi:lipoyl(octanoyl) transferase LipB [Brevundimonas sp. NIBR11]|uniref:lipoyl(octanoyl) transferase LipB n=1 Tax=Brevundimonas sp. NIBR11 TaxID=3015999 RepID=UPI0022F06A13|nr:lipoyl(octanoyl) transferase LipB [Brevundimonas sp. NIBR11]WGM30634.1 Octanoyltransferase [Brevundimonas sp. NIBR11]